MEVARDITEPEEYGAVWQILGQVAKKGEASLGYGIGMLGSPDPVTRSVGYDLLGCASDRHESVRDEAASALLGLAPDETDADVAWSLACAFGRTPDERAIPVLVTLAGRPDADVRCQVAQALPAAATGDFGGIEVGVLVRLTGDPDADVRDWAMFGLGSRWPSTPRPCAPPCGRASATTATTYARKRSTHPSAPPPWASDSELGAMRRVRYPTRRQHGGLIPLTCE